MGVDSETLNIKLELLDEINDMNEELLSYDIHVSRPNVCCDNSIRDIRIAHKRMQIMYNKLMPKESMEHCRKTFRAMMNVIIESPDFPSPKLSQLDKDLAKLMCLSYLHAMTKESYDLDTKK